MADLPFREEIAHALYARNYAPQSPRLSVAWPPKSKSQASRYLNQADAVIALLEASPWPWQSMDSAPRDGTEILVVRDNGCGYDYATVWWGTTAGEEYPWVSYATAYPADRFDYWMEPPLYPLLPVTSQIILAPENGGSNG